MQRKPVNRLRALRAALEPPISQMDLALEVGMSRDRYWRIEKGYDQPTETELGDIARALNVSIDQLGFGAAASHAPEAKAS